MIESRGGLSVRVGLLIGPVIFLSMMVFSGVQTAMPAGAWLVAAVALWMALWWSTEAVPVASTAFIPLIMFPLLGVEDLKAVAQSYAMALAKPEGAMR